MLRTLNIAATGMLAQQLNVDVISNNIANMNTTAYKKQRAEFQDLLYENIVRPGASSSDTGTVRPSGIQLGTGVQLSSVYRITTNTTGTDTGNALDVMINGRGYFQAQRPNGDTAYTRAGSFTLNGDGVIVTQDGFPVLPEITVPSTTSSLSIDASGQVFANIPGQVEPQLLGQFELANFLNESGLEAIGSNLFVESTSSGAPQNDVPGADGFGTIQQARLENSNVNVVTEITDLIKAQRAYETNSRVIRAADEMSSTINQV